MKLQGSKILILGGWGLVGAAICRRLMPHEPGQLIVSSLKREEAEDAVAKLREEFPGKPDDFFVPKWGNIFARNEYKDMPLGDILCEDSRRKNHIADIFDALDDEALKRSSLYRLIDDTKPDLVIDCINTATTIAYQDVYNTTNAARIAIEDGRSDDKTTEILMSSLYIPQLIRHVQILYNALLHAKSTMYIKIGTSGTGGMGLNIPYTHSEEKPSRVLLAKAAVAGAQSLLLYLAARTPNGPLVKEIKPTAAIAWKRIAVDKVYRKGKPIPLVDMKPEAAKQAAGKFKFDDYSQVSDLNEEFVSAFIDTGENGIFSRGEYQAISAIGQMEMVTPEEIAENAVFEAAGGNTGKDIVQGLDAFSMGPTYRGGYLQNAALDKIKSLEKEHGIDSVAFELLGPPRLSKLLFEAYLIRLIAGDMKTAASTSPEELSDKAERILLENEKLRSQALSIGLVILLSDGRRYLRGREVKIPVNEGRNELEINEENLKKWRFEGWLDLTPESFKSWTDRLNRIMEEAAGIPEYDTSSRNVYTKSYWNDFGEIEEGKIVGWIFEREEEGFRFKR